MNKILSLFEYIHYRGYRFFKEKGDNVPEFKGTLILSLMQFLTLINIVFIVQLIHNFPIPSKFVFLPLLVGIGAIDWYLYERNFDAEKVELKWKEGKRKRALNGWLIGIYFLISLLFPVTIGVLEHNLKLI
jgi:hypothetical protein